MQKLNVSYFIPATALLIALQLTPVVSYADGPLTLLNTDLTKQTWANYLSPDGKLALMDYWDGSSDGTFMWTSTGGISTFPTYSGYTLYINRASISKTIFAGTYNDGSYDVPFIMNNGVVTGLGGPVGNYSIWALSDDGTAVAGSYQDAGFSNHAFYYDGTFHTIDAPASFNTNPTGRGMSADGSTVTVKGQNGLSYTWNGGVLTELSGINPTDFTTAKDISADGSIVVGDALDVAGSFQSFATRWVNGTLDNLGQLTPGFSSYATLVSSDGTVIAGQGNTSANTADTFIWKSGTMTSIGSIGSSYSFPMAINGNGNAIAGFNEDNVSFTDSPYYWSQTDGMKSFQQILTDKGVDLTGWDLDNYAGMYMSADGKTVLTTGIYNGDYQAYLFSPTGGLITPQELQTSLLPATTPSQQIQSTTNSNLAQNMFVARNALTVYLKPTIRYAPVSAPMLFASNDTPTNPSALQDIAPAAGGDDIVALPLSQPDQKWRHATYATGTFGSSVGSDEQQITGNATAGVITQVQLHTAVGVGVLASHDRQETHLGGKSTTDAAGMSVMVAHENPSGINVYASLSGAAIDIASKRNYLNGASVDSSKGDTTGYVVSGAIKTGYEMRVHDKATVMPYVQLDAAHSLINGYTETGGGFPAAIQDRSDNYLATRTGIEISHDVAPGLTMRGQTAWGHRLTDIGSVVATAGSITQTIPDNDSGRDWAEFGLGLNKQINEQAIFAADVAARAGSTSEPDISLTLGLVWNWN